jgi:DNA-binding CsgD family transcriptional regulator
METDFRREDAENDLGLSPKEKEVIALLKEGLNMRETVNKLCIGRWTGETHLRNICEKIERQKRQSAAGLS